MRSEQEVREELKKVMVKHVDATWNNKTNVWVEKEVKMYALLWVINDPGITEDKYSPSETVVPIMQDGECIGKKY